MSDLIPGQMIVHWPVKLFEALDKSGVEAVGQKVNVQVNRNLYAVYRVIAVNKTVGDSVDVTLRRIEDDDG